MIVTPDPTTAPSQRTDASREGHEPRCAGAGAAAASHRRGWPHGVAADRSAGMHRPLAAALAVVAACMITTLAVRGSEEIDSGWAVARPSTALDRNHPADPTIRIAINHVLEQGQVPLLRFPAPLQPPDESHDHGGAVRTVPADGWQPVRTTSERPTVTAPRELGPRLTAAGSLATPAADDAAVDRTPPSPPAAVESQAKSVTAPPTATDSTTATTMAADPPVSNGASGDAASDNVDVVVTDKPQRAIDEDASDRQPPDVIEPTPEPLPPLSRSMQNLRTKVRRVLKGYYNKPLNSRDHDPWEMMHGMLAYGVHSRTRQGGPQGELVTSVGWLCYNRPCKKLTLLYVTPEGELRAKHGVGLQGHMGQFLAMLAQCQVSPDYPIRVGESEFAIQDLIEAEKKTCYPKTELTFKLIALMHYLDSDAKWVNDQGMAWDIPRLIREELAQPIRGAACGGTHRLAGLSLAARTRARRGEPLDGEFARAAEFVEKYHNYAFQLQNPDGSLSTEWFRGRGNESDLDRRIKTTGHILEWLNYSLSDEQLLSSRTVRAVNYLSSLMLNNFSREWEIGARSHAIHALKLYDERVFQAYDGQEDEIVSRPRSRQNTTRATSRSSQR